MIFAPNLLTFATVVVLTERLELFLFISRTTNAIKNAKLDSSVALIICANNVFIRALSVKMEQISALSVIRANQRNLLIR